MNNRARYRLIPFAMLAVMFPAAAAHATAGASTPFVSYEAESGALGGGASVISLTAPPTTPYASPELEASGHAYVALNGPGQSVSWTNNTGRNVTFVNVRYSIPDAPTGGGITATLDLYVDGVFRQALNMNSRQTWQYEGNNHYSNPTQNPSDGDPIDFWDDTAAFISGAAVAPGSTITLQVDPSNTAQFYDIDAIDVENPPAPAAQPANSLSITDYGAVADDNPTNGAADPGAADSSQAIQNCIDDAEAQGKIVWIPQGTFYVDGTNGLQATGVTIEGAGMWYSKIYRNVPLPNSTPLGALFQVTSCHVSGFACDSDAMSRNTVDGGGGAMDTTGTNWTADGIWTEHTESGFWASGTGGTISNCRLISIFADGANINNVSLGNTVGNNITERNNFVRGTGDDGIAINSVADNGSQTYSPMQNCTFENNTVIAPWGGKCIAIYGGSGHIVQNNYGSDTARYIGLGAGRFGVNGSDLLSATITGNVIVRCGGNGYSQGQPAMHIGNGGDGQSVGIVQDVTATGNTIIDPVFDGIGFTTGSGIDVENNTIQSPWRNGVVVQPPFSSTVTGSATLKNNTVTGLAAATLPFINHASGYTVTQSGNSWQQSAYAGVPYGGTPWGIPGTVQFENYDTGGYAVGYLDSDTVNSGGQYRTDGVDIENCGDTGGGYDIGWTNGGEWLNYSVDVAYAGNYNVSFRVASGAAVGSTGGTFHLLDVNGDTLATVDVPGTGGWQTWSTVNATVTLPAGTQVLEVYEDTGGFNLNWMSFAETAPNAPTGLTAAVGNGRLSLSWTASFGATSYNVYRGTAAGGESATPIATGVTSTTYVDTGLTNGTTYYYEVSAVDPAGESGMSNEASATPTVPSSAIFVKSDTSTSGSWKGVYGADGYNVINDTSATEPNYPAYATISATGNNAHTWASSTTSTQALQWAAAGSSNRIAACWYNFAGQTIDVNLTDNNAHQVALYLLDWDSTTRAESISIADAASGAVLDTRSASSFHNGVYEVWKISGHVTITITKTGGANAVISGLFFDSAPVAPTSLSALGGNGQVALSWSGGTGAASYNIYRGTSAGGEGATPIQTGVTATNYIDTTVTNGTTYYYQVTAVNSVGEGAVSNEASATPRLTPPSPPANLSATGGNAQSVLTWTGSVSASSYNVYEGTVSGGETLVTTGVTSTTYTATGLTNGTNYFFEVTAVNPAGESGKSNEATATPSAGPTATATFVKSDTSTSGSWKGMYGADGYNVINDTSATEPNYPAYATVAASGNNAHTWAASTTNTQALLWAAAGSTNRIAACWYNSTSESIDLNLTDGKVHQVALYLLDYDNGGRAENVSIVDAGTGTVLSSQSASSFSKGVYEVWNISGHVTVTVIRTAGANAVVSGLFFDGPATAPSPPTSLTSTGANGQAKLTWTGSTGATSYNVYEGTTAGGEGSTPIATGVTGTSYTETGLTNGATYYFEVTAVSAVGESGKSNEALVTMPTSTAVFVKSDASTSGSWKGVYGADGYNIINDTSAAEPNYPAYATVTPSGNNAHTWAGSTTNTPALQWAAAGSTNRIAACWYNSTSQSIDVNLTDGNVHQLALYLLDYDNVGRVESLTITDVATGAVLDTRSVSSFNKGVYEVWNVNGHVKITITKIAAANGVVSGIFFR